MNELLFDTPWWLPVAIVAAGLVVFVTGNKRVEPKVRLGGLLVIVLGIGLAALSYFVDTALETAERRSHELVEAFEDADWPRVSSILAPNTAVTVLNATIYSNREDIVANAQKAHERYRFQSLNILSSTATQTQTEITITIVLLSQQDAVASMLRSEWQFEWRQSAEGWALTEIRALKIGQSTGEQTQGMFPK